MRRENRQLRLERVDPVKAAAWLARETNAIPSKVQVRGRSSSGYHAWVKRQPSPRAETDAARTADIRAAHAPYTASTVCCAATLSTLVGKPS
jgi:hypothetical protein